MYLWIRLLLLRWTNCIPFRLSWLIFLLRSRWLASPWDFFIKNRVVWTVFVCHCIDVWISSYGWIYIAFWRDWILRVKSWHIWRWLNWYYSQADSKKLVSCPVFELCVCVCLRYQMIFNSHTRCWEVIQGYIFG